MLAFVTSLVTPLLLKVPILGWVREQKLSHPEHACLNVILNFMETPDSICADFPGSLLEQGIAMCGDCGFPRVLWH